jgi:hypothetical protein
MPLIKKDTSVAVTKIPQVELSPLRQRWKQKNEESAKVEIKEEPKKSKKTTTKPKVAVKKSPQEKKVPPKVFASPTWFRSPNQKKIQAKNKGFDELRDLFRRDPNNTEEGISKIINDLKL